MSPQAVEGHDHDDDCCDDQQDERRKLEDLGGAALHLGDVLVAFGLCVRRIEVGFLSDGRSDRSVLVCRRKKICSRR